MKLAFDVRGGLIGVFQGGLDGRQTLSGRPVGRMDRRRRRARLDARRGPRELQAVGCRA